MGVTWTVWLILGGLPIDADAVGGVAPLVAPGVVVREVARSAERFTGPPAWAARGIRGMSSVQVQRSLGAPNEISADPAGRVTWSYVVGSDGGSVRSVYFVHCAGRVESTYFGRVTATPGSLRFEF